MRAFSHMAQWFNRHQIERRDRAASGAILEPMEPRLLLSSVAYLGADDTAGANWRTAATAKPADFDPDGDDVYGSDGYLVAVDLTGQWNSTNGTVLSDLPTYVSGVTTPPSPVDNMWGGIGSGSINDPRTTTQPTNVPKSIWCYQAGPNIAGQEYNLFSFTLSEDATFVLGVIHKHAGGMTGLVPQLRVYQTSGGSADSGFQTIGITATDSIEYSFFTISGTAGDQFTVSEAAGWNGATSAGVSIEGLTFEAIPAMGVSSAMSVGGIETVLAEAAAASGIADTEMPAVLLPTVTGRQCKAVALPASSGTGDHRWSSCADKWGQNWRTSIRMASADSSPFLASPVGNLLFDDRNDIRRFSVASNGEAGEHFASYIGLMANLLSGSDGDASATKGIVQMLYEPACGMGGILSVAEESIGQLGPDAQLEVLGQGCNAAANAILGSDVMIEGQGVDHIAYGDRLPDDRLPRHEFDDMLAGVQRLNDGSSLFTGGADSDGSGMRRGASRTIG